jgi:hypothetical protein
MPQVKQAFKFAPTMKGIAIFYGLILFDLGLVLLRKHSYQENIVTEASAHISNFALTSMLVATLAFVMALQGAAFKFVIWLGIFAILLNFIVEVFIPILNTPDVLDAVYGAAGVLATWIVMRIFYKVGIRDTAVS